MIFCIGEILVDELIEQDQKHIFPGGAPFNVARNIQNLNGDVIFYGAVGQDGNGRFLLNEANKIHLNHNISVLDQYPTSQAIVSLNHGERSFHFNRDFGADYHLDIEVVKSLNIQKGDIVHLGSLMLSKRQGQDFFFQTVKYVQEKKGLISFDVNYREDIFKNKLEAIDVFKKAIQAADIVKFSEDELKILTGEEEIHPSLSILLNDKQIAFVTLGEKGSIFYGKDHFVFVPSQKVTPLDTTGAGDAFYAYILFSFNRQLISLDDDASIKKTLKIANKMGALTTLKKGAVVQIDRFDWMI